ncbi:DUF1028 domain-containing protein [Lutimaribacter sp. EGI FJ00015]|uniref:DUF1028 domain-containing protein n=1 Tax=Lutimaribacter degradans TaxID=2945989 RepID=A0ACC5ZTY9_9RHOB|nr:DUF1028 domain-containing protein [Lutimaribacter sp. EGI FJ00013]MCM2561643.1 DUF1028 domain-containing protein [Lutimaribacter sp. EGI FJ00013]MCO0612646.1 DUF1028 domain-containing protein [Lutimaribacter sp. EGI FJ00015]MCO0635304.1 DUF1028 domain-containing protein [Lutimaribacter sp. EGI FJ00014]
MTYSIVARDPATGHLGIAVASRFFAVGGSVPFLKGRVGAIATQAFVNPTFGPDALRLLEAGAPPDAIVPILRDRDNGHANRQFHLVDAQGRNAAFTGDDCVDWCGHCVADGVSVAGNMLEGPAVIDDTLATYQAAMDRPLIERLLVAMQAGEDAGGDKRGKQSACLVVCRDQDYAWLDIRADDHADPLEELRRLYAVAQERFLHLAETMPTRENPHGMMDRRPIDATIERLEAERVAAGRPTASHMVNKG